MATVRFLVQDLFSVTGKGIVLVGRLEAGVVRVGDRLCLTGGGKTLPFTVGGIDVSGSPGLTEITDYSEDFALLARGISSGQAAMPCVVTEDGSVTEDGPGKDGPAWPPPARFSPPAPRLLPPGSDRPSRTLTPSVWLDALLGLPAGFVLFYLVGHVVQSLTPDPTPGTQVMQAYASLGVIAAACAPVCLVLGRRFPILAALTALGVLGMIVGTLLLIPWYASRHPFG